MCWFQCAVFYVSTAYCWRENALLDQSLISQLRFFTSSSLAKLHWVGPVGNSTHKLHPERLVDKFPVIVLTYLRWWKSFASGDVCILALSPPLVVRNFEMTVNPCRSGAVFV